MAYNFRSSSMFSLFIMLARIRMIRYVTFKRPFLTTCVSKWSRAIHDLSNQFCSLMVSFRSVFKIAFEKWFFVLVLAQEHECQFGLVEYSFERSHNACFETVATSQSLSTQLFDHKEGSALHPAESCQNTLWKWIRLCKLIECIYFIFIFRYPSHIAHRWVRRSVNVWKSLFSHQRNQPSTLSSPRIHLVAEAFNFWTPQSR